MGAAAGKLNLFMRENVRMAFPELVLWSAFDFETRRKRRSTSAQEFMHEGVFR